MGLVVIVLLVVALLAYLGAASLHHSLHKKGNPRAMLYSALLFVGLFAVMIGGLLLLVFSTVRFER